MRQRLNGNQRLIDAIVPTSFVVGCRRPTPGNGYLEALLEPNVTVFTKMFQRITPKGFIDDEGNEHEVDAIVCATYVSSLTWVSVSTAHCYITATPVGSILALFQGFQ